MNPWGVSKNPILWEPSLWQSIPVGNWRPHPCHGHSRGLPPFELRRQQGNTHAPLLPTASIQRVTGPRSDGQFVFGWFSGCILAGCKWLLDRIGDVAHCGHGGMCYHQCLQGDGMFCHFSHTQRSQTACDVTLACILWRSHHPAAICLCPYDRNQNNNASKCGVWTSHQSLSIHVGSQRLLPSVVLTGAHRLCVVQG